MVEPAPGAPPRRRFDRRRSVRTGQVPSAWGCARRRAVRGEPRVRGGCGGVGGGRADVAVAGPARPPAERRSLRPGPSSPGGRTEPPLRIGRQDRRSAGPLRQGTPRTAALLGGRAGRTALAGGALALGARTARPEPDRTAGRRRRGATGSARPRPGLPLRPVTPDQRPSAGPGRPRPHQRGASIRASPRPCGVGRRPT